MFELADAAVEGALAAGARYADARVMVMRTEGMTARNGVIEGLRQNESAGVGVRALVGSSWGFFATPSLDVKAAGDASRRATAIANASAMVSGPALELAGSSAAVAHWDSTWIEHPIDDVSLSEKADLLVGVTTVINESGVGLAESSYAIWDTEKWLTSSEGHRISQHIVECGAAMNATAIGDGETQRRSYPGIRGQYGTSGWELVRSIDLPANAARIADEALALLQAPEIGRASCRERGEGAVVAVS